MKIDFTLRLVTPAYAGGADQTISDGIRPPTVKALLRFWWRTMHSDLPPQELFKREARIFGSTKTGQGLRIKPRGKVSGGEPQNAPVEERDIVHTYLAYGAVAWNNETRRPETRCARIPQDYAVNFALSGNLSNPNDEEEIKKALWLFSVFGTLGSRSRRGWGSIKVDVIACEGGWPNNLPDPCKAESAEDCLEKIGVGLTAIFGTKTGISLPVGVSEPQHTSFSPGTRIALGAPQNDWYRAMEKIFMSFGHFHRALGAEFRHGLGKVGQDHNKRYGWLTNRPVATDITPAGSAFGLPHNATFSIRTNKIFIAPGEAGATDPKKKIAGRRASPVFFKVIRTENHYIPLVLWLPSLFLPNDPRYQIHMKAEAERGGYPPTPITYGGNQAIRDFFDGENPSIVYYPQNSDSNTPGTCWKGILLQGWTEAVW